MNAAAGRTGPGREPGGVVYRCAAGVAAVSGMFSLVVAVLLIANVVQLRVTDPLNSTALLQLREAFAKDSQNEILKADIRALDLLARRAFFTSQAQLRSGGLLLLGGVLLGILCLQIMRELRPVEPCPDRNPDHDTTEPENRQARWAVGIGAVLLAATALVAVHASRRELSYAFPVPVNGAARPDETGQEALPPERRHAALPGKYESPANWPNFRGEDGNGLARGAQPPAHWDGQTGEGILWKTVVPRPGYSSPVVWGARVFVTGADAEAREVFCYDASTGTLAWRYALDGSASAVDVPDVEETAWLAASTATTDGRHVCAIFATGEIVGLTVEGQRLWIRNLGKPDNHYAHCSSLLIEDGVLIVQLDDAANPRLLGLDPATGESLWVTARDTISWASPSCVEIEGQRTLVLVDCRSVTGFDPATGAALWSQDCLGGEVAPSAAYADGKIFVANEYAVAAGLRIADGKAGVLWTWDDALPDTASPLAASGCVFLATSYGTVTCLDAESGEPLWQTDFPAGFNASPLLAGSWIHALDLEGVMHRFRAARNYEAGPSSALGENAAATPAFVGDRVFLRGTKHLVCAGLVP